MNKSEGDYLKNFNNKYYLFCKYIDDFNKAHKIKLYSGSLRSIIKYTSYKSPYKNVSINNNEDLLYLLNNALIKKYNSYLNDRNRKITFFMSPDKNGRKEKQIIYSNDLDILYLTSLDFIKYTKPLMITAKDNMFEKEKKIDFSVSMLKLIDPNYKEKLNEKRDTHNRTTPLDILRVMAYNAKKRQSLRNSCFEELLLSDIEMLLYAFEVISKDYEKKLSLMKLINEYLNINSFFTESQYYNRLIKLNNKLKNTYESKEDIEQSIYNSLKENNLIIKIEKNDIDKNKKNITEQFCLEDLLKREESYGEYLKSHNLLRYNDAGESLIDCEYDELERDDSYGKNSK